MRLTRAQYDTVIAHCYDGYPEEACGLLAGTLVDDEITGTVSGSLDGKLIDCGVTTRTCAAAGRGTAAIAATANPHIAIQRDDDRMREVVVTASSGCTSWSACKCRSDASRRF